jgi:hypothetical protein
MKTQTQIKNLRIALAAMVALALALALVALYFHLPDAPPKKPRAEPREFINPRDACIIVAELTDAGRALPAPSPDKPAYYIPHIMGQSAIDGKSAPHHADLQKHLASAFASNGYHPGDLASTTNPPTQVIFLTRGMHNKMDSLLADRQNPTIDTLDGKLILAQNETQPLLSRAKTIGGQQFANEFAAALAAQIALPVTTTPETTAPLRHFAMRDAITRTLVNALFNDRHFLIIYSLDSEALKRRERKILWTLRISTDPQSLSPSETLPILIHTAAPFLGRETPPKLVRKVKPQTAPAPK